jgi:hypothetical protein
VTPEEYAAETVTVEIAGSHGRVLVNGTVAGVWLVQGMVSAHAELIRSAVAAAFRAGAESRAARGSYANLEERVSRLERVVAQHTCGFVYPRATDLFADSMALRGSALGSIDVAVTP